MRHSSPPLSQHHYSPSGQRYWLDCLRSGDTEMKHARATEPENDRSELVATTLAHRAEESPDPRPRGPCLMAHPHPYRGCLAHARSVSLALTIMTPFRSQRLPPEGVQTSPRRGWRCFPQTSGIRQMPLGASSRLTIDHPRGVRRGRPLRPSPRRRKTPACGSPRPRLSPRSTVGPAEV